MEDKASSIRWQAVTINQLSYISNLIFTLTVAAIAFEVNSAISKKLEFSSCLYKMAFILSLIVFSLSFIVSIWLFFNRLKDFRDTTEIARIREDNKEDKRLPELRAINEKLGKKTWCLFNAQIITFCIGMALAVISFIDLISKNISPM